MLKFQYLTLNLRKHCNFGPLPLTQFSYFSTKTYIVGTPNNRLYEHMLKLMGNKEKYNFTLNFIFAYLSLCSAQY